jgi:predicted nuclease of predicted toxin-antitoxin system
MRFLLDENQSPLLVGLLGASGHNVVHVRELGLAGESDQVILALAAAEGRVIVTADTDFGELLAQTNAAAPSVILLRRQTGRRAAQVASLVLANLACVLVDLDAGAIVVLDEDRLRVRSLPIRPEE